MTKLIRKHDPLKNFRDYKRYKQYLRLDFDFRCCYCEASEPEVGGQKIMQIDHYKPKTKFPLLMAVYKNLFYACPECNRAKWNYWPTKLQRLSRQYILNPCDHDIGKHIDKSLSKWVERTLVGKWNIGKLKLASPSQVERREHRETINSLVDEKREALDKAYQALQIAQKLKNTSEQSTINTVIIKIENEIAVLLAKIEGKP